VRESRGSTKPEGAMKVKAGRSVGPGGTRVFDGAPHHRPVSSSS
jgi:hypothetical protein